MDRRVIALVWVGGIVLAAAVYAIGPQQFLAACEAAIASAVRFLDEMIATLMWRAFEVLRAAAIALYVVFVCLPCWRCGAARAWAACWWVCPSCSCCWFALTGTIRGPNGLRRHWWPRLLRL